MNIITKNGLLQSYNKRIMLKARNILIKIKIKKGEQRETNLRHPDAPLRKKPKRGNRECGGRKATK